MARGRRPQSGHDRLDSTTAVLAPDRPDRRADKQIARPSAAVAVDIGAAAAAEPVPAVAAAGFAVAEVWPAIWPATAAAAVAERWAHCRRST